jgi:hypothetical protein
MFTTIYQENFMPEIWAMMLEELGLPSDTIEFSAKAISHVTESQRKKKNADSSGT